MIKASYLALATTSLFLATAGIASAHVIVTPNQVGIAETQTFDISVPSEEAASLATVGLRLVIPAGLQEVTPTVEPGWTITTKTDSNANVTEIDWTGGSIPSGQRADLTFRAQAPATVGTLNWKAYQTYSDGSIISWDQTPIAGRLDDDSLTPYSQTQVINDLTAPTTTPQDTTARWLGGVGIVLALMAILVKTKRR